MVKSSHRVGLLDGKKMLGEYDYELYLDNKTWNDGKVERRAA